MITLEGPLIEIGTGPVRRERRRPSLHILALAVSVGVHAWLCRRFRGFITDDA